MRQDSLQIVLLLLPQLSATQLRDVQARVNVLLQFDTSVAGPEDSDVELVLFAIAQTIAGLGIPVSVPLMKKSSSYPSFKSSVPLLMHFIRKATKDRTEQQALLRMGVMMLYQDLEWMKVPTTPRTLMQQILNLPASLDKRFPGYAKNGMLSWVLQKEAEHERDKSRRRSNARRERGLDR